MTKFLITACIGLLGSASAAQPPLVVSKSNAPFKVVSYGDLNLTSKSGQERLSSRIRSAARAICFEDNIEQVKFTAVRRNCYETAISDAHKHMYEAISRAGTSSTLAAATLVVQAK